MMPKPLITALQLSLAAALALSPVPRALAQSGSPPPLAVLDFQPKGGISPDEASIISDRVRTRLFRSGRYQLMERANMLSILKEQGFQQTQDNCDSTSCSVEIGRLLAVNQLMTGSVSKLGSIYTLSYRIVDVERGVVLHDAYRDCRCSLEEVLTNLTGEVLAELTTAQSEPVQPPTPTPPPVNIPPTPTPPPISLDPALAERIAAVPLSERQVFYEQHAYSPLLTSAFNLTLPFGYIYLDDWGKFWALLGIEAALIALPMAGYAFLGYYAGSYSTPIALLGLAVTWGYGLVDGYLLADQKNAELRGKLLLSEDPFLLRQAANDRMFAPLPTLSLLKWQASF